jgi:hypothetical protein
MLKPGDIIFTRSQGDVARIFFDTLASIHPNDMLVSLDQIGIVVSSGVRVDWTFERLYPCLINGVFGWVMESEIMDIDEYYDV